MKVAVDIPDEEIVPLNDEERERLATELEQETRLLAAAIVRRLIKEADVTFTITRSPRSEPTPT